MTDNLKVVPTLAMLRDHKDAILRLAAHYRASNVRVFGSVARGDAGEQSDVDLLVNFNDSASLYDIVGLKQELEDLLHCRVDIVEDHASLRERFRLYVEKDAVPL